MKINLILPELSMHGGIRVIASYAEQLRRRGHDVFVVSQASEWANYFRLRSKFKALLTGKGWPAYQPPRDAPSHFDQFPLRRLALDRSRPVENRDLPDADVVVATWWETAEWVARLSPAKGAKAYFIQQYEANFDQPADRVDATWRLPLHKIVAAQWLADFARDRFGISNVSVSSNGIDVGFFDAEPRDKQLRPTVGLMYSPHPPKSWPTALAVLIQASRVLPDLRIRLFGISEPLSWLPLPPGAEYERLPSQERIREIYSGCDAWLCTSSSEGFHLPPHEAMACRCPVVSTRVGGPMDLVNDGVNGFLAEPFDAVTLTDRLVRVLTMNEREWRAMSDAAYNEARRHTWELATDRFEQGLLDAIASAAPRSSESVTRSVVQPSRS